MALDHHSILDARPAKVIQHFPKSMVRPLWGYLDTPEADRAAEEHALKLTCMSEVGRQINAADDLEDFFIAEFGASPDPTQEF